MTTPTHPEYQGVAFMRSHSCTVTFGKSQSAPDESCSHFFEFLTTPL
ncbi:MAG: hypothetical protein V7L29_12670 [Nostoc sp.]